MYCSISIVPDIDECRTVPGACKNGRCLNTEEDADICIMYCSISIVPDIDECRTVPGAC